MSQPSSSQPGSSQPAPPPASTPWLLVSQARDESSLGQQVEVRGWVRTRRDSKGGFSFIEINDGSCFGNLQIVADAQLENYESVIKSLAVGSSIAASGSLQASQGQGQATELIASSLRLIGNAPSDFPLQKKRHSFEKLREWAHLRPRTNSFGAVTRVRNRLSYQRASILPGGVFLLRQYADHYGQRLRRGGADVPRYHTAPRSLAADRWQGRSFTRLLWQARLF